MLVLMDLCKSFGGTCAVSYVSLELKEQMITALIGPNGAGKTTLFDVITGFLKPDAGKTSLNGVDLTGLPPHLVVRHGLSRTFQSLRLIRELTVLENIMLAFPNQKGTLFRNVLTPWKYLPDDKQLRRKASDLLDLVGLQSHSTSLAHALSYGQQKLLTVAACLATGASWLLLDEPVAGISPQLIPIMGDILRKTVSRGVTVLLIEHNLSFVRSYGDRAIAMDAGRVIMDGTVDEVLLDSKVRNAYLE